MVRKRLAAVVLVVAAGLVALGFGLSCCRRMLLWVVLLLLLLEADGTAWGVVFVRTVIVERMLDTEETVPIITTTTAATVMTQRNDPTPVPNRACQEVFIVVVVVVKVEGTGGEEEDVEDEAIPGGGGSKRFRRHLFLLRAAAVGAVIVADMYILCFVEFDDDYYHSITYLLRFYIYDSYYSMNEQFFHLVRQSWNGGGCCSFCCRDPTNIHQFSCHIFFSFLGCISFEHMLQLVNVYVLDTSTRKCP